MLSESPPLVDEPTLDEPIVDGEWEPPVPLLLLAFSAIAVLLTFPNLSRFGTHIAGDSGDSLLELWVLRRVEIGMLHGWHSFWDAPIFYPASRTMAYSDTLFPVALVHWPLRTLFGDVVAFNLISLASWVLSSWCVYRLARRVATHWGAAFVAALAYTYAAIRLEHQSHFQLVVGGALVPLALLLLLRGLDEPTKSRAVQFGVSFAAVTLTASYYGALLGVIALIVAVGWLLARRPAELRTHVVALGIAVAVVFVLVAPAGVQYLLLQRDSTFRRGFSSVTAAHAEDFLATSNRSPVLSHVPFIASRSTPQSRTIENRLFPGFVAIGFGLAGAVVLIGEIRRRGWRVGRARELLLIALAGLTVLVLSIGDWIHLGHRRIFFPFILFRHLVPGFAGIRAVARLALGFELALVLLAAVGVDALLRRIRPGARAAVAMGVAGVVVAECAIGLVLVRVPTSADDGGVDVALRALPVGVVVELPIMAAFNGGGPWAFTEAPRQLLALSDHDPRVNGYSGFQPRDFDRLAATLNHFPAPDSLAALRRLGVHYVVLRTALVTHQPPAPELRIVDKDGVGKYLTPTAARTVGEIPPGVAARVEPLVGGYVIVLANSG